MPVVLRMCRFVVARWIMAAYASEIRWAPCRAITLIHLLHHLRSFEQQEQLIHRCYETLERDGVLGALEVADQPSWKFMLSKLVDNVAYAGDTFYFRAREEYRRLFSAVGFRNVQVIPVHRGRPLSHVLYVAQK